MRKRDRESVREREKKLFEQTENYGRRQFKYEF